MSITPICTACSGVNGAERLLCVLLFIACSYKQTLKQHHHDHYRLHLPNNDPSAKGRYSAEGCEQALAEIIERLAQLKLPGVLCDGRRA
jgi:hypothetical protein